MEALINEGLQAFVRQKVRSGEFSSEVAVIEAALRLLRDQEASPLVGLTDLEFVEYCGREGDDSVTLDEVLRATSTIPGSMAQAIIEEERADRF